MAAGGHLGFLPFSAKREAGFMSTFTRAMHGSDTQISISNLKMTIYSIRRFLLS